jgi:two-component system OmpR family sensor kinase
MADAALSALLSLASHELRGPTGVVRGYLKLLDQDTTLGEKPRRVIGEAARASDRLVELLDEVGELARFNDGSVRLALRSMSIRSLLAQAVQAVTLPASHDVELDVVAPVDVRLRVDEARMRAVFETLIVTLARSQTGAATIDLQLAKGRVATNVTVTTRSLGRGAVVDRPLDISRGGTGLQVPIADAVVQAHGGRLRERWVAGRWAGFVVKLS